MGDNIAPYCIMAIAKPILLFYMPKMEVYYQRPTMVHNAIVRRMATSRFQELLYEEERGVETDDKGNITIDELNRQERVKKIMSDRIDKYGVNVVAEVEKVATDALKYRITMEYPFLVDKSDYALNMAKR